MTGEPLTLEALMELYPAEARLTDPESGRWLHAQGTRLGPGALCVDVGVWCGWTACLLAAGGATVLAVDTFRASDRWTGGDGSLGRLGGVRWGTLDKYAAMVGRAGLGGRIVAVQALSVEAAGAMAEGVADLVFLDADHSRAAVAADVAGWASVVKPGGILCGDNWRDIEEVKQGVRAALAAMQWPEATPGPGEQLWWTRRP
jgi:hypothetical protein